MTSRLRAIAGAVFCLPFLLAAQFGCAPRVNIATGTTVGLKASPGDAATRLPRITLAYKRAEAAFVPTEGKTATASSTGEATDAYSTLAAFYFETAWFGNTEIASFIATGFAARDIQAPSSSFGDAFAQATLGVVPEAIQQRREALIKDWQPISGERAKQILDLVGYPVKPGKNAKQSLQDAIKDAQSAASLAALESAFFQARQ
jgi:hypothetical protein